MTDTTAVAGRTVPSGGPRPAPRRRRIIRWVGLAVALAAIGVGAVLGSRLGKDPTLVTSPLLGKPAPQESLPYLERPGALTLRSLRGQIVVVNFWASWCVACRQEHPVLTAAAAKYRSAGVIFVGVDFQDQRSAAVGFLNAMGRGPRYLYVTDPGSKAAVDFGVFGVPETFFIDRSGIIVAKITGASTAPLLAGVLDDLLAGRPPRSHTEQPVQPGPTP